MFHLSLLRSVRPFVFGNRSVWRKSAFVDNKFPWKRSFSKPSCSHSMACERENLTQTGDLSAGTKWIKKTTIRLGTFNLLAPCYKTIEPRYEIIYCVCVCANCSYNSLCLRSFFIIACIDTSFHLNAFVCFYSMCMLLSVW